MTQVYSLFGCEYDNNYCLVKGDHEYLPDNVDFCDANGDHYVGRENSLIIKTINENIVTEELKKYLINDLVNICKEYLVFEEVIENKEIKTYKSKREYNSEKYYYLMEFQNNPGGSYVYIGFKMTDFIDQIYLENGEKIKCPPILKKYLMNKL